MQESFSRRKLIEPSQLKKLNEKSDFIGFLQLFSHVFAIIIISILHYQTIGTWWFLVTGFCLGVLINFLYAAQHELSHGTVFKTFKINEFFGRIIGFFMLFPRDFDQVMHFAHHRWTQEWEKDGELVREPFTIKTYILWFLGFSYWYNRIFGVIRRARGIILEPYITKSEHGKVILESRLHVLGYLLILITSLFYGSWMALTFWILPMVLTKPIHQMQNTIEHLGLTHKKDILQNTRSTRTNFFMKWMCWQMPYHTAHHTFPSVPFWKLKELNSKIESNSEKIYSMGYIEFQIEIIKRLWQKDESQWPLNEVWVVSGKDGTQIRVPAE